MLSSERGMQIRWTLREIKRTLEYLNGAFQLGSIAFHKWQCCINFPIFSLPNTKIESTRSQSTYNMNRAKHINPKENFPSTLSVSLCIYLFPSVPSSFSHSLFLFLSFFSFYFSFSFLPLPLPLLLFLILPPLLPFYSLTLPLLLPLPLLPPIPFPLT